MKITYLVTILLVSFMAQAEDSKTAPIMTCSTYPQGENASYISVTIDKDGDSFKVTASAYNRTNRDVVETFIKTKVDGCEVTYTKEDGKYFNCYKYNPKTGMKDFGISNVYVVEHTLETVKYNLPRKSYRIELVSSSEDKSIDQAKFNEIIGNQNFMNLSECQ